GANLYRVWGTFPLTVTTINCGPNADVVALGSPTAGLFSLIGPLFVNGGGGAAGVVVKQQGQPCNTTHNITPTTVTRPGWTFTYAGVNSLVFNGGSGADVYNILGTALGTTTTVNGGPQADVFNLGNVVTGLNGIAGPLFVNGGGGAVILN